MDLRFLLVAVATGMLLFGCGPERADESGPTGTMAGDTPSVQAEAPDADARASRARVELQGEPEIGPAAVLVYVLDEGEGVSGAEIEVRGDMTHAGMTPVIAPTVEVEPGLYQTEGFRFTMAGDWILTAEIVMPDGTTSATQAVVTVPAD